VFTLFVDYGQSSATAERHAAERIADHYGCAHTALCFNGASLKHAGEIRGRNALLLLIGLTEWAPASGKIALGVHAGTSYADCTLGFISHMQKIFDLYTGGEVVAATPFLALSKREIWEYARTNKVPVEMTHSCEAGTNPCGTCTSCVDRNLLHAL
jgi:7-cyano-7-deazaguanine synthase